MRSTSHSGADAPDVRPTDLGVHQPGGIDLGLVVHEVRGGAELAGHLGEPVRVRRVHRADHQDDVGPGGDLLHGVLPVLRRVADVLARRTLDRREARPQDLDDLVGLVTDRVVCVR